MQNEPIINDNTLKNQYKILLKRYNLPTHTVWHLYSVCNYFIEDTIIQHIIT